MTTKCSICSRDSKPSLDFETGRYIYVPFLDFESEGYIYVPCKHTFCAWCLWKGRAIHCPDCQFPLKKLIEIYNGSTSDDEEGA